MYRHSPRHKNGIAAGVCITLSLIFVLTGFMPLESLALPETLLPSIRIGGLLALSVAVYIAIRYLYTKYVYELEPDPQNDNELMLTITEIRGRRQITVCRIGTADIERFEKLQRRGYHQKSNKPEKAKIYNYCVDLRPNAHIIVLKDDAECLEGDTTEVVIFMPDEKMAELITNVCRGAQ